MSQPNETYATSLLETAAEYSKRAGIAAAAAIEEFEGLLPADHPRFFVGEPKSPRTPELYRLQARLTRMRSAASRCTRLADELQRYADGEDR